MITNNKFHFFFIISLFFSSVLVSCDNDFLVPKVDEKFDAEAIFSDRGLIDEFLGGLYGRIPVSFSLFDDNPTNDETSNIFDGINISSGFDLFNLNIMSDDFHTDKFRPLRSPINVGTISISNTFNHVTYYEMIRLCNIFMDNIDNSPAFTDSFIDLQTKKQMKGQARFLRAYYHWLLMRVYGPIVIAPQTAVNDDQTPVEQFQVPRSTWDDCVSYVLEELELAKEDLPEINTASDSGRADQLVVLALVSQIKLYHASPLYNGNLFMQDFQNLDGTPLLNAEPNPRRWEEAAEAAQEAIDFAESKGKALYSDTETADDFDRAVESTKKIFYDEEATQIEGIWTQLKPSSSVAQDNNGALPFVFEDGQSLMAPTQRLVDDFRTENGIRIQDDPIYREDTYSSLPRDEYYQNQTNTMFTVREPRFYSFIFFNGSRVNNSTTVEFISSGNSGKETIQSDDNFTSTGYLFRKNIPDSEIVVKSGMEESETEEEDESSSVASTRRSMIIRMAELYLNLAEALNEIGDEASRNRALEALNKVRVRGGIPPLNPGENNQRALRNLIHIERRIELCGEGGHRFSDVRRWMIAESTTGDFEGMNVEEGGDDFTNAAGREAYHTRVIAFSRPEFRREYYFLPYPIGELRRNPNLVNFPGY